VVVEDELIRSATTGDVPALHGLITHHAERNRMLFRSHANLYDHLRDFMVAVERQDGGEEAIVACAALESVWRDLAEIKSLAVEDAWRGRGLGPQLVQAAIEDARRLGIKRVFALTREEAFFEKLGFHVVPKETLPHKVWTDCVGCPVQDQCDEIAVVRET
jgi:amino-acid N-acetyltransferase